MKWSRTVLSCDCHDTFHGDPPELHSFPTRRSSDLARAIVRLALSDAGGVAHVTSCDGCTWHGLAVEAIRLVGLAAAVEAVPASTYYSTARRPRNSALHTGRLTSLLGRPLRPWREAVAAYLVEQGHLR